MPPFPETQFEAQRGVSEVEVLHGFAQVHVPLGAGDIMQKRIHVLGILAENGISHKYLKLTQDGLAFIIREDQCEQVSTVLGNARIPFELNEGRSVVLVKAIGMWEERGMIASVLEAAIASGVHIDHVGDMHDRLFLVVQGELAEKTATNFRERLQVQT